MSSVRPLPHIEENKLLLNEYLDHVFLFLFFWKMTFSNPPTPLKYGKFHTFLFLIFEASLSLFYFILRAVFALKMAPGRDQASLLLVHQ